MQEADASGRLTNLFREVQMMEQNTQCQRATLLELRARKEECIQLREAQEAENRSVEQAREEKLVGTCTLCLFCFNCIPNLMFGPLCTKATTNVPSRVE